MKCITIKEFKKSYKHSSDGVYLYGASVTGRGILQLLEKVSIKVEAFIDKDPDKRRKLFCGYNVILPQDVAKNASVIITTSSGAAGSVDSMLRKEYGIEKVYYFELESIIVKHLFYIRGYDADKIDEYEDTYQRLVQKYNAIVMYPMWADRVGEFVCRYMIMQQDLRDEINNRYRVVLPYVRPENNLPYANTRMMEMISRQCPIVFKDNEEFWAYVVTEHITEIELYNTYIHTLGAYAEMAKLPWEKTMRYTENTPPVLNFSRQEEEEAYRKAEKLGIKEPFVCIFARDSSYLMQRKGNWSYHDYRDSDINNFRLMAEYLKERGIQVVRVGTVSKGRLFGENVIDITNDNYDELLDLYVNAKCICWIGAVSGAEFLSGMFRRRKISINAMLVDSYDITPYFMGQSYYIPKLYFSVKENRYLSLKEMLVLDLSGEPPHLYKEKFQVDIIQNTAEDILELYLECEQKESGTWEYTEGEKSLQEKYQMVLRDIRKKYPNGWVDYAGSPIENHLPVIPIGSSFLKKYQSFLLQEYKNGDGSK